MNAAWVAGTTRAKALARRRIGVAAARRLAGRRSVDDAVLALAETPYGHDVHAGQDLATAQHAVLATLLWHIRILAGWLPARGTAALRALAGWFEIASVEGRLFGEPAFEPGAMATAWPALRETSDLRGALAASAWGDPGGSDPRSIQLGMRISWAGRVATLSPSTTPWAAGALALLVAGERFLQGRPVPALPVELIGTGAAQAATLAEFVDGLYPEAAWALRDVTGTDDLWRAEGRWWLRVERDGAGLLSGAGYGLEPVLGVVAVLAADARRVRAALELAARGGQLEVFDALVA